MKDVESQLKFKGIAIKSVGCPVKAKTLMQKNGKAS